MTRPISVTVVAWIIIAISIEGLIGYIGGFIAPLLATLNFHNTYSLNTNMRMGAIAVVFHLVLAVLMLRGISWARVVYFCLLAFGLIGTVIGRQPVALAISIALKISIFGYFLFRRESNEYFDGPAGASA